MDTFTGVPGSFEQWERSFKRARAEATAYPNISIGVLTSFNDFNQDSFEMLMDYVLNNLNVKDFSFSLVRGHVTYRPHINLEKFNRLMIEYYAGKPGIGVLNTCHILFRESLVTYKKSNRFMVPCVSGKMRVVLSPDGDVYPCEALGYPCGFHAEQWCMGNIRSAGYNIPALLKTDLAGNIQNRIRTSSCHCDEACERSLSLLCSKKFQLRVFGRLVRNAASRMFHRQKTPARISPIT
jgi:radical SAM protein with 4Fe4S-binding SPASM domain